MKRLKQTLVGLMAVTMIITSMAGCGSSDDKSATETTKASTESTAAATTTENPFADPIEITVGSWDVEGSLANADGKDPFLKELKDKLNITLKPVNTTWDDYTQKIQVWAASGQLPDIFSIDALGTTYYRNWISQGVVKALPEDLSKYPTFEKYLDKPDIQALKEDGKLYTVPRSLYDSLDYCAHDRNVVYRWDLAQKAGVTKEPTTWEEFNAMLKTIIEKDPEGKKITGLTAVNTKHLGGFLWLYSNPAATSDGSGSDFKWIKEDGKFIPAVLSTKLSVPSLQNARNMYQSGLVDRDIAQIKGSQGYDKFVNGQAAAVIVVGYANLNNNIGKTWKKLYPDKPLMENVKRADYFPSSDGNKYHATFKTYWSESYININVDDKKMDRIMRFYDFMLQPETKMFYRFGEKDVDYKMEGDKVVKITNAEDLALKMPSATALSYLVEWDNAFQYNPNNATLDPEVLQAAVKDLEYVKESVKVPEYEARLTNVSTPTKDKFSILDHDFMLKIMMGKDSVENMWQDVLKEYEGKGLNKMIEEVNAK